MKQVTRKEVRQSFKNIGYSISFVRNSFKSSICNIAFKNSSLLKPFTVSKSTIMATTFYNEHRAAFELAQSYNGAWLADTDQKIV